MENNTHQPLELFAAGHGLQTNQHGRVFENGKTMDMAEKVRIGHEILNAMLEAEERGTKINISALSHQCWKVGFGITLGSSFCGCQQGLQSGIPSSWCGTF
jgi:hypothetical protein